jgi:hypothetical protein
VGLVVDEEGGVETRWVWFCDSLLDSRIMFNFERSTKFRKESMLLIDVKCGFLYNRGVDAECHFFDTRQVSGRLRG